MNSFSLKQQNHFSSFHLFILHGRCCVFFFLAVLCCGQALTVALSLALSPLSHSVFNICPVGLYLSQPFSTRCHLLDTAVAAMALRKSHRKQIPNQLQLKSRCCSAWHRRHTETSARVLQPVIAERAKCQTVTAGQI